MDDMDTKRTYDFMLHEYDRVLKLELNELSESEHRVDFFLQIASATVGIIVLVSKSPNLPIEITNTTIQIILGVLLLFGWLTLNRLNARSAQLRAHSRVTSEIQSYFSQKDPEIMAYIKAISEQQKPSGKIVFILRRLRGTLVDFIIYSNACISSGIVLVSLGNHYATEVDLVGVLITFIGSLVFLYWYHDFMAKKLHPFG
jgi:hypothetical protein